MGSNRTRSLRSPDEVWDPASDLARRQGMTMTDVVNYLLRDYIDNGALPEPRHPRPPKKGRA